MRTRVLRATAAATLLLAATTAFAQAQPGQPAAKKPTVEEQTVRTKDGWTLPISYYKVPNKETPVVVLIHGRDGNRLVWKGFAEQLQQARFAVVAFDLRKHGDSQPPANAPSRSTKVAPADHKAMAAFDLEAVKDFLLARHHAEELNIRKTAIVAADDSAPVAVNWAVADWAKAPYSDAPTYDARTPRGRDVRAIVLLSPTEGAGGLNLGRALPQLKAPNLGVAFLIAVGELDADDRKTSEKSYERLTAGVTEAEGQKRVYLEKYPNVKGRGVDLLATTRGQAPRQIVGFLDKHLKQLPDKWQSRKSRL